VKFVIFPWSCLAAVSLLFLGLGRTAAEVLQPELPGVEVLQTQVANTPVVLLRNTNLAEITVSLDFTLDNITPSTRIPFQIVVAPQHTTPPLVALRPTDRTKPWHFSWRSNFAWGSPAAHHDTNQLYGLPFEPGRTFRVVQGHDGVFTHTGEDRFAIDFGMQERTPVLAARAGLVVLVRDGFDSGAPDPELRKRVNFIFIRHSDGTLGDYAHLLKGSLNVRTGDTVVAGQALALSGNSGYSRGPHLHFMVFRAKDSKARESLPIRFVTKESAGVVLEEGKSYTAPTIQNESPN